MCDTTKGDLVFKTGFSCAPPSDLILNASQLLPGEDWECAIFNHF